MAAGNLRVTRKFCESCSAQVKFEKSSINWGGGVHLVAQSKCPVVVDERSTNKIIRKAHLKK